VVVLRTSFHSLARVGKALSSLDTLRRGLVYTRPEALGSALRGGVSRNAKRVSDNDAF
jgi:hypothetical protein